MLVNAAGSAAGKSVVVQPQSGAAAAGSSEASAALVAALRQEIAALEPSRDADPAVAARARAKQALRSLAADLLAPPTRSMSEGGLAEGGRELAGFTISARRAELDASIEGEAALDEADWTLLASRLASVGAVPPSETQRALRDAIAPIVRAASAGASGTRAPSMQESIKSWGNSGDFPRDLVARVSAVDPVLVGADASPAHRASAQTVRARIIAAGDLLATPPDWLAAPARERIAADLGSACEALVNGEGVRGGATLASLHEATSLLANAARLPASPTFSELHKALSESVASGTLGSLESPHRNQLNKLMVRLADRPDAEKEERIIRPLRSTLRGVSQRARSFEPELIRDAMECLRGKPEAISLSPAWERYSQARTMMDLVRRASGVMAVDGRVGASGPEPANRWTRLCSRILRLSQDLARPDDRSPLAGEELRLILGLVDSLYPAAESPALTGSTPIGVALLGDQRGLLASTLNDTRQTWLSLVDKEKDEQAKGAATVLAGGAELVRLVEALEPLAALWSSQPAERDRLITELNAHPGLEVPASLMAELAASLPSQLQDAAKLLLHARAEEAQAARGLLREARRAASPLLVMASWRGGLPVSAIAGSASAWSELAGIEAWEMPDGTADAAARLSIKAHELQAARQSSRTAETDARRVELEDLALSVLDEATPR